jgi:hypothetical protein
MPRIMRHPLFFEENKGKAAMFDFVALVLKKPIAILMSHKNTYTFF